MLSIIHQVTPNALAYEAVPADAAGRLTEMCKRIEIVENFVKDLGTRAGIVPSKIDALCIGMNDCMFSSMTNFFYGDNVIFLPDLLFMDFAKDFGVGSVSELREKLGNSEWVDFFCDRCTQILGRKVIDREGIDIFRQRLDRILDEPQKSLDAMKYEILVYFKMNEQGVCEKVVEGRLFFTFVIWLLATAIGLGFFPMLFTLPIAMVVGAYTTMLIATKSGIIQYLTQRIWIESLRADAHRLATMALPGEEGKNIRQGAIYYLQGCSSCSWWERILFGLSTVEADIEKLENLEGAV